MDLSTTALKARPDGMAEAEWQLRLQLAACYRVFSMLGWTELIFKDRKSTRLNSSHQ